MARRPVVPTSGEPAARTDPGRGSFGSARIGAQPDRESVARREREGWLRRLRLSGFSAIMVVVLVLGVLVIAPNLKMFVEQQQQISALQAKVDAEKTEISDLTAERERWNDKTFITTQARNRLYYVNPGEVSYIVVNDLDPAAAGTEPDAVSDTLATSSTRWDQHLLASFLGAGLGK